MKNEPTWYKEMMQEFNQLIDNHKLSEEASRDFHSFIMDVARNQYMQGYRDRVRMQLKKQNMTKINHV